MQLTLSIALISAVITGVLIWIRRVSAPAAIVVWLSGFTAAATVVAGPVRTLLTTVFSALH